MSINTTVKVGFDGTAVKSGLKNIGGMFGKFSKEVGIGATRKVGEMGTDAIGKIIQFFSGTPGMFIDYFGDLKDLSTLTTESTRNLQILQEAFRLAGVDSVDAGKSILLLAKSISTAKDQAMSGEGGDMVELFDSLKIGIGELSRMKPREQIEAIFSAMKNANFSTGQQFDIMQKLFGKGGIKMLQAFRDNFPETMTIAEKNLGGFADMTKEAIDGTEALGDALGRLDTVKMSVFKNYAKGYLGDGAFTNSAEFVNGMFDKIQQAGDYYENIGKKMREQIDHYSKIGIEGTVAEIKSGVLSMATDIGDKIGKSFSAAVDNYFKGTMIGAMMTKSAASQPSAATSKSGYQLGVNSEEGVKYMQKTVEILQRIYREGGAIFQ